MSFIDNPVIASLGNSLGLGDLFASASNSVPKPATSKPNIPPYRERPYIPRSETPAGMPSGGVQPGGGTPPVTPGAMSQDTLFDPGVHALLGEYGVHPSTAAPDPNLFIHNPEAFVNHPLISGLLERGLEGAAFSHPGANFLQSLVGGVRGMQEANAERANQVNAQVMAPLQQAQAIASLRHLGDEHDTALATQKHMDAMSDYYRQMAPSKAERAAAIPPKFENSGPNKGRAWTWDADQDKYVPDKDYKQDPQQLLMNSLFQRTYDGLLNKYKTLDDVPTEELGTAVQNALGSVSRGKGASKSDDVKFHEKHADWRAVIGENGKNNRAQFRGNLPPDIKSQAKSFDLQERQLRSKLDSFDKSGMFTDENGHLHSTEDSAEWTAFLGRQKAALEDIANQRDALYKKAGVSPQPNAPATPQTNNPLKPAQTNGQQKNPFRH